MRKLTDLEKKEDQAYKDVMKASKVIPVLQWIDRDVIEFTQYNDFKLTDKQMKFFMKEFPNYVDQHAQEIQEIFTCIITDIIDNNRDIFPESTEE